MVEVFEVGFIRWKLHDMACNSAVDQACIIVNADGEPVLDNGHFVFVLSGDW